MLSAPQGALSTRNARIKIILAGEKFTNTISLQARKRVGPPLKNQGSSSLDNLQDVGYYRIMKKIEIDTDQKTLNVEDVMKRVITAVNIATGDDGSKAKEVLDTFKQLCLMSREQYAEQVKHYG